MNPRHRAIVTKIVIVIVTLVAVPAPAPVPDPRIAMPVRLPLVVKSDLATENATVIVPTAPKKEDAIARSPDRAASAKV